MRPEVDDWFRHISKQEPLQTKFDLYYLCLLLGLASGRSDKPTSATEFVDDFVRDYKPMQRLIIGLMLVTELSRLGVDLAERGEVQIQIARYLDPNSPADLTEEGFNRLNAYASGGFNYIVEQLGDKPRNIEEFLQIYVKMLRSSTAGNELWKSFGNRGLHVAVTDTK